MIEAFQGISKFAEIEDIELTMHKILNYLLAFKYNNNDVENTYYYLKALNQLSSLPIFSIEKFNLDSTDEKEIFVKVINVFGKEIKQNLTVNYKVFNSENTLLEGTETIQDNDNFSINMTNKFSKPGKYYVSLSAGENKMVEVKTVTQKPVLSTVTENVKEMITETVPDDSPDSPDTPTTPDSENSDIPDVDKDTLDLDENKFNNKTDTNTTEVNVEEVKKPMKTKQVSREITKEVTREVTTYEDIETVTEKIQWFTKFSNSLKLLVSSKVKINYLKCSVTNSGNKEEAKEL